MSITSRLKLKERGFVLPNMVIKKLQIFLKIVLNTISMKRQIISKKVRKASFKEIEKILAFQVEQMKEEASYDKQEVNEDEMLEYYIMSKKNLIYVIRTYLRFNTGEKIILFDCFALNSIDFEDKRGNYLMLNYHYILQNDKLEDINDADILFEE